jgi:hypothetical protein
LLGQRAIDGARAALFVRDARQRTDERDKRRRCALRRPL